MRFGKLFTDFSTAQDDFRKERNRLQKALEDIQMPSFHDQVLVPFATSLCRGLGKGWQLEEILGPFGLSNEYNLTFKNGRKKRSLIIFKHMGGLAMRDYSIKFDNYAKGSIGAINGGNHPIIEIPNNTTFKWFEKHWIKG